MTIREDNVFVSNDGEINDNFSYKSLTHFIIDKITNEFSDSVLFVDGKTGKEWTGREIKEKVLELARALIVGYDFKQGTAVCITFDHSTFGVIFSLAVVCAGGIVAYSYPKDPYAEILYLSRKVEPRFLFCHQKDLNWAKQLEADMGYPVIGVGVPNELGTSDDFLSFLNIDKSKLLDLDSVQVPVACVDLARDIAFVSMSSGTTGSRKAVPVTHKNCIADLLPLRKIPNSQTISVTSTSTLDYVSGRLIVLAAFQVGYRVVIFSYSDIKDYYEAVEKYKIFILYIGVTSMYNFIMYKDQDKYDISSVRSMVPMGGKVTYLNELTKYFKRHPHIVRSRNSYGCSESSVISNQEISLPDDIEKFDCSGKLRIGIRAKIKNPETGKSMNVNQTGLVYVKGDTVFPGYYDLERMRKESNLSKVSPIIIDETLFDEDGFYLTGDLGYFSEDEDLYIVGRYKEVMNCRQWKVLPYELEDLLSKHPVVSKVCVLGIESQLEKTNDCPRAYICIKQNYYTDSKILFSERLEVAKNEDHEPEVLEFKGEHSLCTLPLDRRRKLCEDIMMFADERLAWAKQLTGGIVLLDRIPELRTGKPDKVYLRSLGVDKVEIYGDRSC